MFTQKEHVIFTIEINKLGKLPSGTQWLYKKAFIDPNQSWERKKYAYNQLLKIIRQKIHEKNILEAINNE